MERSRAIATAWWDHFNDGNYAAAAGLLAEGTRVDWPVSGERMQTPAEWLAIKEAYPAASPWKARIVDMIESGGNVVTFTSVFDGETVDFAISRFTIEQDRIVKLTEYWLVRESAPDWRARWIVPLPDDDNPLCRLP